MTVISDGGGTSIDRKPRQSGFGLADENMLPLRSANFVSGLESMPVVFTPSKSVQA